MDSEVTDIVRMIIDNEEVLIFGGMIICGSLAIIFGTIASIVGRISTERSRREIAAYIAEGSLTPEQGERLMSSNPGKKA